VVWLVAHHAPVTTPGGGTVSLLPLALLAVPLLLLHRAGRWAARVTGTETVADAVLLVVAATAAYAGIAVLVAQAASMAGAQVSGTAALACAGAVAVVGLSLGVAAGSGLGPVGRAALPEVARRAALVASVTGAALVAAAALLTAVAFVARFSVVAGLGRALAPGAAEAVELGLVSLAYLPNLVLWALSYLAGPGFVAGGGATVDPFSASGALLPGVPVLGAVPPDAPAAAPLLLLVPVAAGVLGALALRRRAALGLGDELRALGLGAVLLGVGATAALWLSGGSLGAARLAQLGPHALAAGLALTALVAAGAALVALADHVLPAVWDSED
jgi:hypothetical protein